MLRFVTVAACLAVAAAQVPIGYGGAPAYGYGRAVSYN